MAAVTLADIRVGLATKCDQAVIRTMELNEQFLQKMVFDDATSPSTGADSPLTYSWKVETAPAIATTRTIGSEGTQTKASKESKLLNLGVINSLYTMDRALAMASNAELRYQAEAATRAVINKFNYDMINGTVAANGYDGIKTSLTGSDTEVSTTLNISTMTEAIALELDALLKKAMKKCLRKPDYLIANTDTILKIDMAGTILGFHRQEMDELGMVHDYYGGVEIKDFGTYYGASQEDICADGDVYFVCLGYKELVGVCPLTKSAFIKSILPDFNQAGAVKNGEVEMVTAIALKNSRAASRVTGLVLTAAE